MGLRIQTNVAAMNAHRQLGISDSRMGKSLSRLSSGYRINKAADDAAGLAIAGTLALIAFIDILVTFELPEGAVERLLASYSFRAGMGLVVLPGCLAALIKAIQVQLGRAAPEWRWIVRFAAGCAIIGLLVMTSAIFRLTDIAAPDIWILTLGSFVFLGLYMLPVMQRRPHLLHVTAWALLAALFVVQFLPMALRWPGVERIAFPKSQVRYLHYLLLESRLTWLPVILALGLILARLFPAMARAVRRVGVLDRAVEKAGGFNPSRWPDQIERPIVAISLVAMLGLGFGVYYAVYLLPGFSKEVSQKHILELYYDSEGRRDLGDNIFKYYGTSKSGAEDKNFYTAPIPEITSQNDLTSVLLAEKDEVIKVNRSSSHPGPQHVLLRGFSAANDADEDGQRDVPAEAGLATSLEDSRLVDDSKNWEPDQWQGYSLYNWRGAVFSIISNDENSLTLSGVPTLPMNRAASSRYAIDMPEAARHDATSLLYSRNYVVLSQEAFSSVNYSFRTKSGGMHIPVLDGTNVNFLMAASYLFEGEENFNRFAQHSLEKDVFNTLVAWTAQPGSDAADHAVPDDLAEHGPLRSGKINFNDQVTLHGFQLKSTSLARGDKLNLRLIFECTGKVTTSWKIFIHMDSTGASNRIHGDHWPLNMAPSDDEDQKKKCIGCWRTNHWVKGDIIIDDFETEVPLGSPSGIYNINLGFYTPGSDKRLKVKDFDKKKVRHDGKDRVFIGTFEVH